MPDLLSLSLAAERSGEDPRYAEVDLSSDGLGFVRLQRVSCLAPIIHGVPTLFTLIPKSEGEGQPAKISPQQSKDLAGQIEAVVCESVCGCRSTQEDEWRRLKVDPRPAAHRPGSGVIHLQVIPAGAQLKLFKAAIALHTGQEVDALLAGLFRGAVDLFARVLAESGLFSGRMGSAPLEPGATGGQRDSDAQGAGRSPEADGAEE